MPNKAKYSLKCVAAEELSTYNKEYNRQIEGCCERDPKFEPTLECVHYFNNGDKCPHLEIKRLK